MAKHDRLFVYSIIPKGYNASTYYRLEVPLTTAEDMGLGVYPVIDTLDPEIPMQNRVTAFYEADVCLFYQPVGEALVHNMKQAMEMIPCKRGDKWKWPPTIVLDTDDNLFDVSPLNHAYQTLGCRAPDGAMLQKGEEVGILNDKGEKQSLWKDGEKGFSIEANQKKLENYRTLLNMADAVTCSTSHSEAYVKRETQQQRTFVTPNCIRLDHYEPIDLAPHPDKVRILWQGSPTHYEDWYPLRDALGYLTRKYPQIEWVIWGALYPWVMELIPNDRYQYIKWMPYAQYKLRLATIGHDINLAPLQPTRFNLCRSAIKWYESSILKNPAATIAEDTGPYHDEIIDGETGLLFKDPQEFIEKVSLLVENATERKRLASNAKDWVVENRDAFKVVPKLIDYYRQLREIKKQDKPQPTEEEWLKIQAQMEEWKKEDAEEKDKAEAEAETQANGIRESRLLSMALNDRTESIIP